MASFVVFLNLFARDIQFRLEMYFYKSSESISNKKGNYDKSLLKENTREHPAEKLIHVERYKTEKMAP